MLEEVLKVLTDGDRRECCVFSAGCIRCDGTDDCGGCDGKMFDEVVRVRE